MARVHPGHRNREWTCPGVVAYLTCGGLQVVAAVVVGVAVVVVGAVGWWAVCCEDSVASSRRDRQVRWGKG